MLYQLIARELQQKLSSKAAHDFYHFFDRNFELVSLRGLSAVRYSVLVRAPSPHRDPALRNCLKASPIACFQATEAPFCTPDNLLSNEI